MASSADYSGALIARAVIAAGLLLQSLFIVGRVCSQVPSHHPLRGPFTLLRALVFPVWTSSLLVLVVSSICELVSNRLNVIREPFLFDFSMYTYVLATWGIYLTKALLVAITTSLAVTIHARDNGETGLMARKTSGGLATALAAGIVVGSTAAFGLGIYLNTRSVRVETEGLSDALHNLGFALDILFFVAALGLTVACILLLRSASMEMKRPTRQTLKLAIFLAISSIVVFAMAIAIRVTDVPYWTWLTILTLILELVPLVSFQWQMLPLGVPAQGMWPPDIEPPQWASHVFEDHMRRV